jgi:hypothetical protein
MAALKELSKGSWVVRQKIGDTRSTSAKHPVEEVHKVGEYYADYSEVSFEELAKPIPEMDDLLQRSRLVSVKRGL